MKHFQLFVSVLFFTVITACAPPLEIESTALQSRGSEEYDEKKNRDDDRKDVLKSSRERRAGSICEDEDRKHECKESCRKMYKRRGDSKDCEELTVTQIEILLELYELLEKPDEDDLLDIEPDDFDVYLNVSIASLEKLIDKEWKAREAKEFLSWLVNNEEPARILEKEDDDRKVLTELFKKVVKFDKTQTHRPFIEKIEDGRLMELAIQSDNDDIIKWFMDYIEEENSDCKKEPVSKFCFAVYCKIGDNIDEEDMEDWIEYNKFESYLKKIIKNRINTENEDFVDYDKRGDGSGWMYGNGENQIKELDDIKNNWVEDLCGGLLHFNL